MHQHEIRNIIVFLWITIHNRRRINQNQRSESSIPGGSAGLHLNKQEFDPKLCSEFSEAVYSIILINLYIFICDYWNPDLTSVYLCLHTALPYHFLFVCLFCGNEKKGEENHISFYLVIFCLLAPSFFLFFSFF